MVVRGTGVGDFGVIVASVGPGPMAQDWLGRRFHEAVLVGQADVMVGGVELPVLLAGDRNERLFLVILEEVVGDAAVIDGVPETDWGHPVPVVGHVGQVRRVYALDPLAGWKLKWEEGTL